MFKICIFAIDLGHPLDEGVKRFARSIIDALNSMGDRLLVISERGDVDIHTNKYLLDPSLMSKIRKFAPDMVIHIRHAVLSIRSAIQARVLKYYANAFKLIMIVFQPSNYGFFSGLLLPKLKPDFVFGQSQVILEKMKNLGVASEFLASGVDISKFNPLSSADEKEALRRRYGIGTNKFVITHIGHIRHPRRVEFLKYLKDQENEIIIVGSPSFLDKQIAKELTNQGIKIFTQYIENIEHIYQASDCYIFPVPVTSVAASIGVPLSILEAMACNLPIVTTKYGGLPDLFEEGDGFMYANPLDEFKMKIQAAKHMPIVKTRTKVEKYSWENVAKEIVVKLSSLFEKWRGADLNY